MRLPGVRVLIWDFDGTFYAPNPALWQEVREAEYRTIMECKGWGREQSVAEFEKSYKKVTPSATQTVGAICGMSTTEAAMIMEKYYDRRKFLARDQKLIALFDRLKAFRHFILANGVRHRIEETLGTLGVPVSTFEEIVTSELSGENKPDERGFRYIMQKSGLPADAHLMIGDREAVDLTPARNLGMHTCLVWSEEKSAVADITVPRVYDLPNALI